MTSAVEPLLLAALDAEWAVQSERTRPLVVSPFVREALELAVARTPQGIFAVAGALHAASDTPEAFLQRVRRNLPVAPDPWTLRMLGRMRSLPVPAERPQLETPNETAPEGLLEPEGLLKPRRLPEPAQTREPAVVEVGPLALLEPATFGLPSRPVPPRTRWRPAAAVAAGAAGGVAMAAAWLAGDALLGVAALGSLPALPRRRRPPSDEAEA